MDAQDHARADYRGRLPVKVILAKYGIRHKKLYRSWLKGEPRRYPKMSTAKQKR